MENLFEDFLHFFFEGSDELFDIDKGFEFLDKELEQLFPAIEGAAPKFVDKLVKVFTKTGGEQWILVHVEVQAIRIKTLVNACLPIFIVFWTDTISL